MLRIVFSTAVSLLLTTVSAQSATPESLSNGNVYSPMPLCVPQAGTSSTSSASASASASTLASAPTLALPSTSPKCGFTPRNVSSVQYRGMNVINQSPVTGKGWKDASDWWVAFANVNNMTRALAHSNNMTNNLDDAFNMTNSLSDPDYSTNSLNAVRLYSTTDGDTQHLANALRQARARNLTVHAGVWSGGDEHTARFAAEKDALDRVLVQYGCDNIIAVSVGNEDLYNNLSTEYTGNPRVPLMDIALLMNQAEDIRHVLDNHDCCDVRVTHTDTFGEWLKTNVTEPLIKQLDFLTVNIFPYWEGKNIDEANATFWTHLQSVKDMAHQYGKEVWLGETGWPAFGPTVGEAVPSVENLQRYWNEVGCGLMKQDNFFWYAEWDERSSPSFGVTKQNIEPVITNMSCG